MTLCHADAKRVEEHSGEAEIKQDRKGEIKNGGPLPKHKISSTFVKGHNLCLCPSKS